MMDEAEAAIVADLRRSETTEEDLDDSGPFAARPAGWDRPTPGARLEDDWNDRDEPGDNDA